jgi:hypothetical protein
LIGFYSVNYLSISAKQKVSTGMELLLQKPLLPM